MPELPVSLRNHRVRSETIDSVTLGDVRFAPIKSLWLTGMAFAAVVGGFFTFSWMTVGVFLATTASVLLFGHSLGSHRKLIHGSFQCPRWLEYVLVYCGVQVGLAGPLGLLRQHELRDYAQRLPDCHPYLRHGSSFWRDAWWQLHCELQLLDPPRLEIEPRIAEDRFYRFLESTWMVQQAPVALLLYALGGWAFVFWGTCARVTACVGGHWLIGYFAHNHGDKHYEVDGAAVQGRNIRMTSLLTMGESWHNNHHAYPGSAKLGLFAGEWDPGWWALMVFGKLGWVWGIRLPADLPRRSELLAMDDASTEEMLRGKGRRREKKPVSSLQAVLRLCRNGAQGPGPGVSMEGPAVTVPAAFIRQLAGPRVPFVENAAAPRLVLRLPEAEVRGLPALLVSMSFRNPIMRLMSLGLAPLAVAFESTRVAFDVA